jgi:hypothetical protein
MLGPVISGSVASQVSWRWFFWACTIAQCLNFIGLVLFFPETRWLGRLKPSASQSSLTDSQLEKKEPTVAEMEATSSTTGSEPRSPVMDEFLGRGRPSRAQYSIFQKIDSHALRHAPRHFVTPVQLFFFPIVLWAAWSFGFAANSLLGLNLLQSQALGAPPYLFSTANVGYANFALVAGGVVGLAVAGPWSDWICARATRKNKGIREPEMRLMALVPFIAVNLVGMTVSCTQRSMIMAQFRSQWLIGCWSWLATGLAMAISYCARL